MPNLSQISPALIHSYRKNLERGARPATVKRKLASLNHFLNWAEASGHIQTNPLKQTRPLATTTPRRIWLNTKTIIRIGGAVALVILLLLLVGRVKVPIPFRRAPAQTIESGGQGVAALSPWKLFANIKLTNPSGLPAVGSHTVSFRLFTTKTGGTSAWSSGNQIISTGTDGSALIAIDNVPADLFFGNEKLFLAPMINGEESGVRIPISTANISANLGGFFPSIEGKPESVPIIDSTGTLHLASETPAVKATSGNLLIEGKAITITTPNGSDGNIEFNPDGSGVANFLFGGNGQNFLNAQAPNLTSGALFYGIVANNATGYNLLKLQSGSSPAGEPTTRFSVDGQGNTFVDGKLTVDNNIDLTGGGGVQIAGTTVLTSLRRIEALSGFNQYSGLAQFTQGTPDYLKVDKELDGGEGKATSDSVIFNFSEVDPSNYDTLVLRRTGGLPDAMALFVDDGNAKFDGQVQLGRFTSNPTAIGSGSLVFNTTDSTLYVWNGSAWTALGGGTSAGFWQLNSKVISPANSTHDLAVGGTATSSAAWQVFAVGTDAGTATSSGQLTFRGPTDPKINVLNSENFGISTSVGGDGGLGEKLTILNSGSVGIGDTTPDALFDIDSADTTGNVSGILATAITTGNIFNISSTSTAATSSDMIHGSHSAAYTSNTTVSGNIIDLSRTLSISGGSQILSVTGALATLSDSCSAGIGATCTHSADVLDVVQNYTSSSGTALYVKNYGGASSTSFRVDDVSGDTTPFLIDAAGNVGVGDSTPDAVFDIDASTTTTAASGLTDTGTHTGTGANSVAFITANSATSGDILTISAAALTSGTALTITGPSSTAATDHFVKLTSDIGSSSSLLYLAPDFSGGSAIFGTTGYGIDIDATDSTSNPNTDYGLYQTLTLTGNAAKTGYGIYSTTTSSSTTADSLTSLQLVITETGTMTTGTRTIAGLRSNPATTAADTGGVTNVYGSYLTPSATLANGSTQNVYGEYIAGTASVTSGTITRYGVYIDNASMNTTGTSTQYGLYVNAISGANTNYAAIFAGGNVGIGTTTPAANLSVQGALYSPGVNINTNALLYSTNAFGAGVGGGIGFGGQWATGPLYTLFAEIDGVKENATDGNYAGALTFKTRTNGGNANEAMRIDSAGNVGIGDTSPDSTLEILSTAASQFRISYTDTTTDATFSVSSTGDLTLDMLGSGTTEQLILANNDVLNIGGSGSTDVPYNVIADSTTGASATLMNSDNDLYIEGNLQVHGTFATPYQQVVTVAKSGGDFTSIQSAIDSITDESSTKRYLVLVYPGDYNETITTTDYIDLRGVDRDSVRIYASSTVLSAPIIKLSSNVMISNLIAENTAGTVANAQAITDAAGAVTNVKITNVKAIGNWDSVYISSSGSDVTFQDSYFVGNFDGVGCAGGATCRVYNSIVKYDSTYSAAPIRGFLTSASGTKLIAIGNVVEISKGTGITNGIIGFQTITGANSYIKDNHIKLTHADAVTLKGIEHFSTGTSTVSSNTFDISSSGTNYDLYSSAGATIKLVDQAYDSLFNTATVTTSDTRFDTLYTTGNVGVFTTAPDAALEINHATGDILRMTYNDSDGSATNYTDFSLDSTGGLTITGSAASIASGAAADKTFLTLTPATITLTGTTQVTSLMDTYLLSRATIAGDTATVTVDDAATLTIEGPPAEGSNVSLTEAYGIKINAAATTATTAYSLYVDAPTGATNNYAAIFNSGSVGIGDISPDALFDIDSSASTTDISGITSTALTSGKAFLITATGNGFTSGNLVNASLTQSAATGTAVSGDIANLSFSPTYSTAVTTPAITGQVLDVSRSTTTNSSFASTLTVSGALATFSDSAAQAAGTLTHTADVVDITQNYTSSSGTALYVKNYGGASSASFRVDDASGDTTPFLIDAAGNVGIGTASPNAKLHVAGTASIFGEGEAGTPTATTIRGAAAAGSNISGANLTFDASTGTGKSTSGDFVFRTAPGNVFVDSTSSGSASNSTLTLTHTVNSGNNRLLIVGTVVRGGVSVSSITWQSQNFTKIRHDAPDGDVRTELWYLLNPTVASGQSITITFSGSQSVTAGAISFFNVDQQNPFGADNGNTGVTGSPTVNVTSATGELVVDVAGTQSTNTMTVGAGQTSWIELESPGISDRALGMSTEPGAATVTMSWSTTSDVWAISAVPIRAFGVGAGDGSTATTANTLNERLRITANGEVGIGTTTPVTKFHVSDTNVSTASAMIENTNTGTDADGLAVKLGFTSSVGGSCDTGGGVCNEFVTFMRGDGVKLGKIHAASATTVTYKTNGADFAEYFKKQDGVTFEKGELVTLDSEAVGATKPAQAYDGKLIGIVSSEPGFAGGIEGEDKVLVALVGQVPVKISPNSVSIKQGDPLTSSPDPGLAMKAESAGTIVAKALEDWTPESGRDRIMAYVDVSWFDPGVSLGKDGELIIAGVENSTESGTIERSFSLQDSLGHVLTATAGFSKLVAANIRAGAIITKEATVDTLFTLQATVDNLIVTTGIVSPVIQTKTISPLADSNVEVNLKNGTDESGNSKFGKLAVKGKNDAEVAAIDAAGNATFSGELTANGLQTTEVKTDTTTVSGNLYAKDVITPTTSLSQIEAMLKEAQADQQLLVNSTNWNTNTATNSATIQQFNNLTISQLFVTDTAAISKLSVTNSIALGPDMVFQSIVNSNQQTVDSLDTLSAPLQIQSLAMAPVEIMAGKFSVDTAGNVRIEGNLNVAGRVNATGLVLKQTTEDSTFGKLLSLQDGSGQETSSISASGEAKFTKVTTSGLVIATSDAQKATVVNGEVITNATAGTATIPAGIDAITIRNAKVTDYTLVYVTPTTPTQNRVLYVKAKQAGTFTVGFTEPLDTAVEFNWWIIESN